jgi:small subunit ribosomal protein S21
LIESCSSRFSAHWPRSTTETPTEEGSPLQVIVRDNNVDQALKVLKKKMQREGVFREMKSRRSYEKPSEKRARQRAEAVRRARKLARKQAQREGLLPKKRRAA